MMELVWIDDFIALEKTQNFTEAAKQRHTTQPAFSRRIQTMELWLGVTLFTRNTRPVQLTQAGKSCKKRIYRLREDIMDMRRIANLSPTNMPDETPVIYTTNTIAVGFLPQWIKDSEIDSYRLVVSSITQALEAIREKRCTYALLPRVDQVDLYKTETVFKDSLVFLGRGRNDAIKNKKICGDIVMYAPGTFLGQAVDRVLKAKNLSLEKPPVCESASAEAVLAQIKNGFGAGWVVESLLSKEERKSINVTFPRILFDVCLIKN